ncbi:MAG: glycine-rich domain-containing protein [Flavobacteriales bacterium]
MTKNETINHWAKMILNENPILIEKIEAFSHLHSIKANDLFIEVLRFLVLVAETNQKLTPSLIVDLAWHEFILFTRIYHDFCVNKLGRFIHHTPDNNKTNNNRNFLRTIQHYIAVFGEPNSKIWGQLALQEWNDSQCGSCETN